MSRYFLLPAMLVFTLAANAQVSPNSYAINRPAHNYRPEFTDTKYLNEINVNAIRHFNRTFGEFTDENWTTTEDGYRADYVNNAIIYHIEYNKAGNWVSTLRVYQSELLPTQIADVVHAEFPSSTILTTNEVSTGDKLAYFTQIQDSTTLKTVSIVDGELKTLNTYQRGDL